ncbi:hypothetical protein [Streptomyces sp. NPDC004296]|uniref:hypothetical protein n=1 Tax=Streptomyces sp. NPDC004296 TaxID=3364697 RepID=UPI0036C9B85B
MVEEALTAVAAAGGAAVVQAAGTDAWAGLRQAVARWFGRGDARRERAEWERLDRSAAELTGDGADEQARVRQAAVWQTRFEMVLEALDEAEQAAAVAGLRALVGDHAPVHGVSADRGGLAVGGNVDIRATHGSAAAIRMGDVTLGDPPTSGAEQERRPR